MSFLDIVLSTKDFNAFISPKNVFIFQDTFHEQIFPNKTDIDSVLQSSLGMVNFFDENMPSAYEKPHSANAESTPLPTIPHLVGSPPNAHQIDTSPSTPDDTSS